MPEVHLAVVDGIVEPLPAALLLWCRAPRLARAAGPGQFVMVRCGPSHDPYLRYPLPIHRLSDEGIALLATPESGAYPWLIEAAIGDLVDLYGPCGRAPKARGVGHVGLFSQGATLGPLPAILDRHKGPAQLMTMGPTDRHVYPHQLLPPGVEYTRFVGAEEAGGFWEASAVLVRWAERIYAYGSPAFYRRLWRLIERERVVVPEGFAWAWVTRDMACGVGACGGCLLPTRRGPRRVCVEGPFFDLQELSLSD